MIHNELQYAVQLIRAYRSIFGEKGSWGVERFGETITPTVDLWSRPEWAFNRGEYLWWLSQDTAATAGEFNGLEIRVPSTARAILVLLGWAVTTAAFFVGSRTGTGIDTTFGLDARDRRQGSSQSIPQSLATAHLFSDAVSTLTSSYAGRAGTGDRETHCPVVVSPGRHVSFQAELAATSLRVTAWGYVRPAAPGELVA